MPMTSVSALLAMVSRGTIEVVWCFRERETRFVAGDLLPLPVSGLEPGPRFNTGKGFVSDFLRPGSEDLLVIDL